MNLNTLSAIISGWKNFTFESPKHEELAKVRAEICAACPHANPEYKFKKYIPEAVSKSEKIKIIEGLGCDKCGCPLSAKVRQTIDSCPIEKW
jgi:hypothetical protein